MMGARLSQAKVDITCGFPIQVILKGVCVQCSFLIISFYIFFQMFAGINS